MLTQLGNSVNRLMPTQSDVFQTSKQTTAAMKAAETQRAKLINMIDLRAVDAEPGQPPSR
jgi:hypothetical protein